MGHILFRWKRVVEDVIWLDGSVWKCYLGGWVFTGVTWLRNGCLVMLIGWEGFAGGFIWVGGVGGDVIWVRGGGWGVGGDVIWVSGGEWL